MSTVWFINHYASTPSHGFGGRTYYFAKELNKRGYNTKLIISNPHHLLRADIEQPKKITEVVRDGVNLVTVRGFKYQCAHSLKRIFNWFLYSHRIRVLAKIYKDSPPDYIFCSSPSIVSTAGARYLSKKFNAKLVIDIRDIWPLTVIELAGKSKNNPLIRLLRHYELRAYRDADLITSNLKNFSKYLEENGFGDKKFAWLPNGYDKTEQPSSTTEPSSKDFVVGYTGTFGLANALDALLNAANLLKAHKDIRFTFVGEGREKRGMMDYCREHQLENIDFRDFVPKSEIQSVLGSFDILTVGAKESNLYKYGVSPNKLFDYMNSGRPIIYYIKSPGFSPIADSGAGIEVPSGAPEEIAAAILKLKTMTDDERAAMGERGKRYAEHNFEYGVISDRLQNLLETLSHPL